MYFDNPKEKFLIDRWKCPNGKEIKAIIASIEKEAKNKGLERS